MSAIESPVADSIYDTANLYISGRIVDEITTNRSTSQYRAVKQFPEIAFVIVLEFQIAKVTLSNQNLLVHRYCPNNGDLPRRMWFRQ